MVYLLFSYLTVVLLFLLITTLSILMKKGAALYDRKELVMNQQAFYRRTKGYFQGRSALQKSEPLLRDPQFRQWALSQLEGLTNVENRYYESLTDVLVEWEYFRDFQKQLESPHWYQRLEGAYMIGVFRLQPLKNHLYPLLIDPHPLVRLKAFNVLGQFGDSGDLETMIRYISSDRETAESVPFYLHVLRRLIRQSETLPADMIKLMEKVTDPIARRCIVELLGDLPLSRAETDWLIGCLHHHQSDVRVGASNACAVKKLKEALPELQQLFKWSEEDYVKITAIKAVAMVSQTEDQDIDYLARQLSHRLWWVRFYSAYGLARLGQKGISRLRLLAAADRDRYGRDMARYFLDLAEKGGSSLWTWEKRLFSQSLR